MLQIPWVRIEIILKKNRLHIFLSSVATLGAPLSAVGSQLPGQLTSMNNNHLTAVNNQLTAVNNQLNPINNQLTTIQPTNMISVQQLLPSPSQPSLNNGLGEALSIFV